MKKIVRYRKAIPDPPKEGYSYVVLPIDHPNCSNGGVAAITSKVINVVKDGFETENTIYIEEQPDG